MNEIPSRRERSHRLATLALPDPHLRLALAGLLFLAVVAVASLPAARGTSAAFGWLPLWLLGMPASGLAVLAARQAASPRVRPGIAPAQAMARWQRGRLPARRIGATRPLRHRLPRAA